MRGLLVSVVMSVAVLGAVYGFASSIGITGVNNISSQTETVLFSPNDVTPTGCTISGGITCGVN